MLNENIKRIRKSKGLSQEELAIKLNVVRQTVSKWENGLSVPDSSMLIILANELDTTVSELLGEPVAEPTTDDLKILCVIVQNVTADSLSYSSPFSHSNPLVILLPTENDIYYLT